MSRSIRLLMAFGTVFLTNCTDVLEPCADRLAVLIHSDRDPVAFSWRPSCLANDLLVERVDPQPLAFVWSVNGPTEFGPPVTFGHAPSGAESSPMSPSLDVGATYRVTVFRMHQGDIVLASGEAEFTYNP